MKRRKKDKKSFVFFTLVLISFFICIGAGVSLCEYNCNSLLGIREPVKTIRFWQPAAGTYCLTLLGNNYQFRQVIDYGNLSLTKDKVYLTFSDRVFVIPTKLDLTSIKDVTKIIIN